MAGPQGGCAFVRSAKPGQVHRKSSVLRRFENKKLQIERYCAPLLLRDTPKAFLRRQVRRNIKRHILHSFMMRPDHRASALVDTYIDVESSAKRSWSRLGVRACVDKIDKIPFCAEIIYLVDQKIRRQYLQGYGISSALRELSLYGRKRGESQFTPTTRGILGDFGPNQR